MEREQSKRVEAALKKENDQLRRKVKRLEKQVEQGIPMMEAELIEEEMEAKEAPPPLPASIENQKCPLCESTKIACYRTPGNKVRWGCKACKKWKA
jgi:hypothetical protein